MRERATTKLTSPLLHSIKKYIKNCASLRFARRSGSAVGVTVTNVDKSGQNKGEGIAIRAKGVVSGAGAVATNYLVPSEFRELLGFEPMLQKVKSSISHGERAKRASLEVEENTSLC